MEEYKPDERYLGYHLEYYFTLLRKRRDIEEDAIQLKEAGIKLEEKLKDFPFELPTADGSVVEEIIAKIESQLKFISGIIASRWKNIEVGRDPLFEQMLKHKGYTAPHDRKFSVTYLLKPRKKGELLDGRLRLADELGLEQRGIAYQIGTIDFSRPMIECYFTSIEDAIEITKKYLMEHSEDS